MEKQDELFWAWLAGFFDGEGHVDIHGKSHTIILYQSGDAGKFIMKYIQDKIGGTIGRFDPTSPSPRMPYAGKERWRWWVCNADESAHILRRMMPYLLIKREKAQKLINWADGEGRIRFPWKQKEDDFLIENCTKMSARKIGGILKRGRWAVLHRATQLGLKWKYGFRDYWRVKRESGD